MKMPPVDKDALKNRPALVRQLRAILPEASVIVDEASLRAYETDALTAYRQPPMLAVLPETTAQVAEVLKLCDRLNVKVVPRGAGTSLSGGALPLADGKATRYIGGKCLISFPTAGGPDNYICRLRLGKAKPAQGRHAYLLIDSRANRARPSKDRDADRLTFPAYLISRMAARPGAAP